MEYDAEAHIPRNFLVEPRHRQVLGSNLCGSGVTSFAGVETRSSGTSTYSGGNNSGYIDAKLENT